MAHALAGRFVVIDGPDGAGKSTQARLLAEHLRAMGAAVCQVRDPGGTAIGDRIRAILLDNDHHAMAAATELMLFMASRAQLAAEVIRPALAAGECVLGDRYISSTIAYQGAAGVSGDDIRTVGDIAVGGLWPDLTIILDVPAEAGLQRLKGRPDRMEAKGLAYHEKVRQGFLDQARQDPARCAVISGEGTIDEVQQRLRRVIEERFP